MAKYHCPACGSTETQILDISHVEDKESEPPLKWARVEYGCMKCTDVITTTTDVPLEREPFPWDGMAPLREHLRSIDHDEAEGDGPKEEA